MEFEKAIRLRQLKPYPLGHREGETNKRWDQPLLDTAKRQGLRDVEMFEAIMWPTEITLQAEWRTVSCQQDQTTAQSIEGSTQHTGCRFYDAQAAEQPALAQYSANAAVTIVYTGGATYKMEGKAKLVHGNQFEDFALQLAGGGQEIYTKQFLCQRHGALTLERKPTGYGDWLVVPPKRPDLAANNLVGLLGYGGYAKLGTPLEDIEQVYARLGHAAERTTVDLKKQSELARAGIAPPAGGTIGTGVFRYMDSIAEEQTLSLAGSLVAGHARITLTADQESQAYRSVSYRQVDAADNSFSITFVPQ